MAKQLMKSDWEAEEDMRTLRRAAEIYRDKGRKKRAMMAADKELNSLIFLKKGYQTLIDSD